MKICLRALAASSLGAFALLSASAEIRLPMVISDHAVLQSREAYPYLGMGRHRARPYRPLQQADRSG